MPSITLRQRNGQKFWEARVIIKGHRARSKSFAFNEKSDAKQWAAKTETELRSGDQLSSSPKSTVPAVIEEFLRHHRKKTKGKDGKEVIVSTLTPQKRYAMGAVAERLADFKVEELTSFQVQRFVDETVGMPIPTRERKHGKAHPLYDGDKERTYTPSAVRKLFYALKEAMTWHARKHDYKLGNRFEGFKLPPAWSKPRDRRLHPGEEQRLLDACDGMHKDPDAWKLLIRLALATGMRAGELLGLMWEDVHIEKRYLVVPLERDKTRKGRAVPLSKESMAVLRELKKRREGAAPRVFATLSASSDVMGKGFKRITKRAGSEGLRFHDLRHEAISRLFELTQLRTMEIALITGHTNLSTLQRYTKLRPSVLAEQIDRRGPTAVAF